MVRLLPRYPSIHRAAPLLLAASVAHATPFFFCESLPDPPGQERHQGFGAQTLGSGPNGTVIHVGPVPTGCDPVPPPTQADLHAAIATANVTANPTIMFPANTTIRLIKPLPPALTANHVTILGNGATLRGDDLLLESASGRLFEIRGHDVILRDLHFRNGGNDNLRIQGPNAYNIVITHVSSTGAGDDGLSISNACGLPPVTPTCDFTTACDPSRPFDTAAPRDITVQYSFFAGNTRSLYIKANNPATRIDRVSVHHNWFTKQWVRGPYVDKVQSADYVNNLVEDWAEWGVKFGCGATGNVAYNVFQQSSYAIDLGRLVDPKCRASDAECVYNGRPPCSTVPPGTQCCPYVVDDPNENNQKKGFNLGTGMLPEHVYTNAAPLVHTNWYLDQALKYADGTAPEPFPMPEVLTLHLFGKVRDAARERTGPCQLTPAQIQAWQRGEHVVCPRHPIDQAYIDADVWCVNAEIKSGPTQTNGRQALTALPDPRENVRVMAAAYLLWLLRRVRSGRGGRRPAGERLVGFGAAQSLQR
jgi:hypothetical protein